MAEKTTLQLVVAKVDGALYEGDAFSVTVPGTEGEMTILPHHEALVSLLKKGMITVRDANGEQTFPVEKGTFEVSGNRATILV